MNSISLARKSFTPFATVTGEVRWQIDRVPKNLELRLFWSTRGRGTEEAHPVASLPLGDFPSGSRPFSFELPGDPWTLDGQLISVVWALELVEKKSGSLALEEIVVSPTGIPVVLGHVESPRSVGSSGFPNFRRKKKGA